MRGISWQNLLLLNASIPKYKKDEKKDKKDDTPTNDFNAILQRAKK